MISRWIAALFWISPVAALAQISPCGPGQQLGNNAVITSGNVVYSSPGYVSAGSLSVNVAGNSVVGNASVTIQAGTAICLGPGFRAAGTSSGGGFTALIGSTPAAGAFGVTTTSLPVVAMGSSLTSQLQASGGNPPYIWSLAAGSALPSGLNLSAGGLLSGVVTVAGSSNFNLIVTDSAGETGSAPLGVTAAAIAHPSQTASFPVLNDGITVDYMYTTIINGRITFDGTTTTGCTTSNSNVTVVIAGSTMTTVTLAFSANFNAAPGAVTISCKASSVAGPIPVLEQIYVYDATPHITSLQQLSPLYPGGQAYVAIYGTNLGPATGSIAICKTGANPCGSSDVGSAVTYWNHGASYDQVNVLLTAAPTSGGAYDLELTSRGETGTGFVQDVPAFDVPQTRGQVTVSPTVTISRAGAVISGNSSSNPVVVSVGDPIALSGAVAALPVGVTVNSQSWGVGGTVVSNYVQSLNQGTVTIFTAPNATSLTFYWIDSDNMTNYPVTYTANLSNNTTLTATALFHVARPTPFSFSGTVSSMTPVVNASNQQNVDATAPTLNFGYNPSYFNGSPGITYNMQATTGYGGSFALLQLLNVANSFTLATNGHTENQNTGANVYVLDTTKSNTIPQYNDTNGVVPIPAGRSGAWELNDGPYLGLTSNYSSVTANENFQTYFMYQPPTVGAIWVTLGVISWSWGGTATTDGSSWSVSATSFSPSPAGATVMYTNSNALPQWSTNITTIGIQ